MIAIACADTATTQPAAEALAALLPREVAGLQQQERSAETRDGHNIAVATYSSPKSNQHIALICTQFSDADTAAAVNEWFSKDVNETAGEQTRRSVTIDGRRALAEHDAKARSGGISIRVNDQTILVMLYTDLTEAESLAAAEKLPLKLIATIK
jgi:hypothetical protein